MKNILVLTSIYPGPDVPISNTPVVHYFVKEWSKLGYNIQVIVTPTSFPSLYYKLPEFIMKFVKKRVGWELSKNRHDYRLEYELDGIDVLRLPLRKYIPHGTFSTRMLEHHVAEIKEYLSIKGFTPDLIIGHWANPQAYLEFKLKELFGCKTSLVLHESGAIIGKYPNSKQILDSIDVWGYRSLKQKNQFFELFHKDASFRCSSGISKMFFDNIKVRNWMTPSRYIYVGTLIKRKHPDVVIDALQSLYTDNSRFSLNIYGDGVMKQQLIERIREGANISLKGRRSREELVKAYDNSDIFIMISEGEVFGLVYLEAMSRGCITIAAKGEGMDGIIVDGVNGFLCNPGDKDDLIRILRIIDSSTIEQRGKISKNAIDTASKYSDTSVAKEYLDAVISQ